MTKKIMKTLAVAMCAVLLVAGSIAGTMAYLTAEKTITNTFTAGNVAIELTEVANTSRTLVPGRTYENKHTITVGDTSEKCYLFVNVENGISAVEDDTDDTTIADQMQSHGWTCLAGNVYYYNQVADKTDAVVVFDRYKIKGSATTDEISNLNNAEIVVTAYAVQAEGFNTAEAAWEATKAGFGA